MIFITLKRFAFEDRELAYDLDYLDIFAISGL